MKCKFSAVTECYHKYEIRSSNL